MRISHLVPAAAALAALFGALQAYQSAPVPDKDGWISNVRWKNSGRLENRG